ncbi:MAG: transposase, partial [bacterium]|nr:transposase [bacterium]
MTNQDRYWAYFDEAWKKIIERFFPQLLRFFVPDLYEDVDFSKGITFLDKEMEQLSKRSVKGAKYVDKLAKVYLKSGEEQWILVHIEV